MTVVRLMDFVLYDDSAAIDWASFRSMDNV